MAFVRFLLPLAFFLALISAAHAAIENPGFEKGDLTGWTVEKYYSGSATVVSQYLADDEDDLGPDVITPYGPMEGLYFALLRADGVEKWTTVKQSFGVVMGDILSGWAAFDYQDYDPYIDKAQVRILDGSGTEIAIPWNLSGPAAFWDGPWTKWSWTSTVTGPITLEYRVADWVDSTYDSYALFDDTTVNEVHLYVR